MHANDVAQAARYREEGVDVETIKYTDNIAVVELIAGRADSLMGALTEECIFPKGSDGSYAEKVKKVHSRHAHFNDMKTEPTAFAVRHFAGEVVYEVDGFLAKNKDPISQDLLVLLQHSGDAWLSSLMKEHPKAAAAADSSRSGGGAASSKLKERGKLKGLKSAKFVGVVDHFQTSLRAVSAQFWRNSGAVLRNSGAILRNYSELPPPSPFTAGEDAGAGRPPLHPLPQAKR